MLEEAIKQGWQDEATSDPQKLKELFKVHHTGIGLLTGKLSGLTDVDIDNKNGANCFSTLKDLNIDMKETVCFQSPGGEGGLHYIYQYCDEIKTGVGVLGDKSGVDIRNDGV